MAFLKASALLSFVILLALKPSPGDAQHQRSVLKEVLTIPSTDSTEWFTRISDLALSEDGRWLVVGQPMLSTVLVFDARTGAHTYTLGRRGSGPGEFADVRTVGVVGDTIFAADLQQDRVVLFSLANGSHIATWRFGTTVIPEAQRIPFPMRLTAEGTFWAEPPLDYTRAANGLISQIPILLLKQDGSALQRVATKDVEGTVAFAPVGNGYYLFKQPLVRPNIAAYAGDGSSMLHVENSSGGRARIRRFTGSGSLLYDRTLQSETARVTGAAMDSLYREFSRFFKGKGPGVEAAAERAAKEHVVVPRYWPSFQEAVVGADGTAWLQTAQADEWLVINPAGHPVARVIVPLGVRIAAIHNGGAWGIQTDSFDVPQVVKYVLEQE